MSNQIADSLFDAIDILLDKKINEAGFDRTIKAVIKRVLDETKGKYEIQYEEDIGVAWSVNNNTEYQVNDEVYVMVPGQVGQREKYILSKVQTEEEKAEQESVNQNDYVTLGRGVVDWNDLSNPMSMPLSASLMLMGEKKINFENETTESVSGEIFNINLSNIYNPESRDLKLILKSDKDLFIYISGDYENGTESIEIKQLPKDQEQKFKIKVKDYINISVDYEFSDGIDEEEVGVYNIEYFIEPIEKYNNYNTTLDINNNKENLITLLNATPYIAIGADFQFDMPELYGNYGLKLRIKEKDKEAYDLIMDINDLEGNPYSQGNAGSDLYDSQLKIFNSSHGEIEDILSFEFFVNDLQEDQINDFYEKFKIKNIFVYGAEEKNQFNENIIINISQKDKENLILKAFYNKISILKDLLPCVYTINKLQSDFTWKTLGKVENSINSLGKEDNNEFIISISIKGQNWYTFSLQLAIKYLKENNKYSYNKNSNILNWNYSSDQQVQLQKKNNSIIRKFIKNENNPLLKSILLGNGTLNKTFKETWENEEPFYTLLNRERETNELIYISGSGYTLLTSSWKFTFKPNNDDCFLFHYNLPDEYNSTLLYPSTVKIQNKTLHFILSAKFTDGTNSLHKEIDTTSILGTPLSKKNPFNYFTLLSLFGETEKTIEYLSLTIGFSCEVTEVNNLANGTKINTNQNELIYFSIGQNGINLNGSKKYSNLLIVDFQNDSITAGLSSSEDTEEKRVDVYYNKTTMDSQKQLTFYYYQFPAPHSSPFYQVIQQEVNSTVGHGFVERFIDEDGTVNTIYFHVDKFCEKVQLSKYHRLKKDEHTTMANFGILWVQDRQEDGGQSLLGEQSNISDRTYAVMNSTGGIAIPILYYRKGTVDYYFISSPDGGSFINIGNHKISTSIFPKNCQFIPEYWNDNSLDSAHRNNLIDETVINDTDIQKAIQEFLNANYIFWNSVVLNQFETSTSEILSIELKSDLHKTEQYYNETDDNTSVGNIPCVQFISVNPDNLHFVSKGAEQEIASLQDIGTI